MDFLIDLLLWPFNRGDGTSGRARKVRGAAANWLDLAEKVSRYRSDRLTGAEAAELANCREDLRRALREHADAGRLKLAIEALEDVLRRVGGSVYPKTALSENVDFFLVAAIVILGIRTYFVQPFKIPTNSMWPTYYGMTAENLPPGAPAPGWAGQAFRFVAFGAQRREVIASRDGEVSAQYRLIGDQLTDPPSLAYKIKPGRKWLFFPAVVHEYTFYVDGEPATVDVPEDFDDFDSVAMQTFFGNAAAFTAHVRDVLRTHSVEATPFEVDDEAAGITHVVMIPLGRTVRAGQPILRFDLMTGDQLFVDRFSYHFFRPKVGEGFVFRTGNIPRINQDEYYIKRLVGVPGDTLEVRQPVLYRNGHPITGAQAFDLNARRVAPYTGYTYGSSLYGGVNLYENKTLFVPVHSFFAMGDNSSNSSDGRVWGFVPAADVIGRPLFVYFPFTRRWGPAR